MIAFSCVLGCTAGRMRNCFENSEIEGSSDRSPKGRSGFQDRSAPAILLLVFDVAATGNRCEMEYRPVDSF
jgi:hypothetical protein